MNSAAPEFRPDVFTGIGTLSGAPALSFFNDEAPNGNGSLNAATALYSYSGKSCMTYSPAEDYQAQIDSPLRKVYWDDQVGDYSPYYVGKLKSYNTKSGFGFIECSQTYSECGLDVFIHKNEVPATGWKLGQYVEFACAFNNRGQPQARDVLWLQMKRPAIAPKPPQVQPASTGIRYLGCVKSFSLQQGYGFLACEDTFDQYKRDVYLDRSQVPSVENKDSEALTIPIGQIVEFEVMMSKRGHPQAGHVTWKPLCWVRPKEAVAEESTGPDLILNSDMVDPKAMQKLSDLNMHINENAEDQAILYAIHCMKLEVRRIGESVDLLSYTLERIRQKSSPTKTCQKLDQFTQMLLLLSIGKTLKTLRGPMTSQKEMLYMWLEAVARTIDPVHEKIMEHFDKVVKELGDNLQSSPETSSKAHSDRTRIFQVLWEKQQAIRADAAPKAWARPKVGF